MLGLEGTRERSGVIGGCDVIRLGNARFTFLRLCAWT